MKRKYTVPIGVLLLLIITFLSTSHIKFPVNTSAGEVESGTYALEVNGNNFLNLNGTALFHTVQTTSEGGDVRYKMKLSFSDNPYHDDNGMTIYFTDPNWTGSLEKGTYYISENISGFMDNFEGVFGFADFKPLGELPYFARKGRIRILESDKDEIAGWVELILSNNEGEMLEVSGNFAALTSQ